MDLKSLSDPELLENTRVAAKNERRSTTVVLHHLREVEARRLFGPQYESLHKYVVKELKYSAPAAHRRISAMRVLKVVPEVDEKIESGSLNLTTLSQAQVFFSQESKVEKLAPEAKREILSVLESKSTREVDRELIKRATVPLALKKDRVRAVSDTLSELKCLVTDEALEDLKKIRGLLAHKHPNLSMGEVLALVAQLALKELDPGREPKRSRKAKTPEGDENTLRTAKPAPEVKGPGAKRPQVSRHIPAAVKREVWRRDQGKCTLCASVHLSQIDHIIPLAQGGSNELENLRLLCFHCNQREADAKLGRAKMESKRKQIHLPLLQGLADGTATHV